MPDQLRVSTLGGLKLKRNGAPLTGFHSRKVDALIVYLVSTRQPQAREFLADLLWDEQTRASANLRVLITDLRQTLAPFFIITRTSVELNPASEIYLDSAAFEAQLELPIEMPRTSGSAWHLNRRDAAATLENALALYRGDFLKGFYIRESPRFEEWVLLEQERLRRLAVTALQRLTNFYLAQREYVRGIETASRLFEIDPLNELTQQQVMELLARSGEPNAALSQYEKYKHLLAAELNAEPSPETTTLRDQIRAGTFAEKINVSARSNLPRALTLFVGRAQELSDLDARLRDANIPLLTLIGMGGVGKTRLALRAAENAAAHFRDGVTFIALASIPSANLVIPTLADALGVSEKGGEDIFKRVENFLRGKQMLLLVDNMEQVLDAAPRLTELLSACPHLKILATSREKLHLYGEHEFPVAPLPFPEPAQLANPNELVATIARYPAVALFVQRATAAQSDFKFTPSNARAVAEICARLDGLPLAIELAAARVQMLPLPLLLERLTQRLELLSEGERDRAPRQQSLRGALDWSYALLDELEKKLFRALAVFGGGWTLNAAEFVAHQEPNITLNLVTSLADKNLAQRVAGEWDTPRFTMLETLREYARECLTRENETAEFEQQHALYFRAFAQEAEPALLGPSQVQWFENIERELDNVRAALQWALAHEQAEIGLELAHALGRFWTVHDHWAEGRRWLEGLLALPETHALSETRARARGLFSAAFLANWMSDYAAARAHLEQARALADALDDSLLRAQILTAQSSVHQAQGDLKQARKFIEQALPLFEKFGAPYDVAWGVLARAGVDLQRGNFFAARPAIERALSEFQRVGDHWACAIACANLGFIARFTLQRAKASAYKARALSLLEQYGDQARIGMLYFFLGAPSGEPAELDAEVSFFQEQVNALTLQNDRTTLARAQLGLASALHRRGDAARAKKVFIECLMLCAGLELNPEAIECLEGFAGLAAAQEQPARAARLFGAVEQASRSLYGALAHAWRGNFGADLALARAQLDEATFDQLWAEGRAMNLEQAIGYALAADG